MSRLWRQSWFLLALVAVLVGGFAAGLGEHRAAAERFLATVSPSFTTAFVLFLMAFSLDSHRLRDSLRRPAGAVWGSAVNLGVLPALAACLLVHAAGLAGGWWGGGLLRLAPEDRIATAIAGSQNTLPVSLLIAASPWVASENPPFVILPLLAYHAIQLVLDTAVADAWRRIRPSVGSRAGPRSG